MFQANQSRYGFTVDAKGDLAFGGLHRAGSRIPFHAAANSADWTCAIFGIRADRRDGKKELILQQAPLLMDLDQDEKEHPLILAKNVDKFIVEFIDSKNRRVG